MDSIRLKNLRSLINTENIDIKPLTVLVGKNSTGKSTFLRFFPLMKQTLTTRKNEPILWYGKDYVDFGSFKESISKNKSSNNISFGFKFNLKMYGWDKYSIPVDLEVDIHENRFEKICIKLNKISILIKSIDNQRYKLFLNDDEQKLELYKFSSEFNSSFLPSFKILNKTSDLEQDDSTKRQIYDSNDFFEKEIKELYSNFDEEEIESFLNELNYSDLFDYTNHKSIFINRILDEYQLEMEFQELEPEENKFLKFLKNVSLDEFSHLSKLLVGYEMDELIERINSYISNYFKGVQYIAPVRASAQRYYRLQGLAVDEIDSQGENIPMVLKHLSKNEKRDFDKWVENNFNFKITTGIEGGHVSLYIEFDEKNKLNLADTGFGYSQILPIIVLLWRVYSQMIKEGEHLKIQRTNRYRFLGSNLPTYYTIVIEQPELHLHPAMQAQLTDVFSKCVQLAEEMNFELRIIIETHSETIINRVGQLVFKDQIKSELVNVLMFGDSLGHINTQIKSVRYNEDGVIEDWPIGFFYPED